MCSETIMQWHRRSPKRKSAHLPRLNAPTQYPRVMRSPPIAFTYVQSVGKKIPRAVSPKKTTHITIVSDTLSSSVAGTFHGSKHKRIPINAPNLERRSPG